MQRIKIVEIKIMTKKKTLKEALIEKGGENYYVEKERETVTNPFFMAVKRGLKECLEVTDITPLGVVYEQVLVGCEPNILNELATIIHTDKETLKFELNVPAVADDIETDGECHEYTGTQAETTEIDVPVAHAAVQGRGSGDDHGAGVALAEGSAGWRSRPIR